MHEVAQRASERGSLEVDLFRLNGLESDYKFTREKMIDIRCVGSGICCPFVNCHDVTGKIFERWISRQKGMKSLLKCHKQPGKIYRTFRKPKKPYPEWLSRRRRRYPVTCEQSLKIKTLIQTSSNQWTSSIHHEPTSFFVLKECWAQ